MHHPVGPTVPVSNAHVAGPLSAGRNNLHVLQDVPSFGASWQKKSALLAFPAARATRATGHRHERIRWRNTLAKLTYDYGLRYGATVATERISGSARNGPTTARPITQASTTPTCASR